MACNHATTVSDRHPDYDIPPVGRLRVRARRSAATESVHEVHESRRERRLEAVDIEAGAGPWQVAQVHREFVIGITVVGEERDPFHRPYGRCSLAATDSSSSGR
jgi:hypothetical protein